MEYTKLEDLSKETLTKLAKMYSKNWQTLDGLWFRNVENQYGLEAAVELDLKMWEEQSKIEARRIKEALEITQGGLTNILKVLSFMSWQLTTPLFECEEETPGRIVFHYSRCPVQEGRRRQDKKEFPCKFMKTRLLSNLAREIEPRAELRCFFCPPDQHPEGSWCKWELIMR